MTIIVARFKLHGLDAEGEYDLTNVDSGTRRKLTGEELMETGMEIGISDAPGSILITYNLIRNPQEDTYHE